MRRGKELFGEDFEFESHDFTNEEACWMRMVLGEESNHELDLMKVTIKNTYRSEGKTFDTTMYLMETVNGPQLVCNMLGFLREEDMEELREYPDCQFGERNNRQGIRVVYKTFAGIWHRIHYFRTSNCKCAEIFLESLARFKCSYACKADSEECEIEQTEFLAEVLHQLSEQLNCGREDSLRAEFYPSFDTKDALYYEKILIYLDYEYFIQINKHPEYQEVVCEEPACFWASEEHYIKTLSIRKRYLEKAKELEANFIQEMIKVEPQSIILMPASDRVPFIHVGEVRVTTSEASKVLFELLGKNRNAMAHTLFDAGNKEKEERFTTLGMKNFY